jgi:hypothetical protein
MYIEKKIAKKEKNECKRTIYIFNNGKKSMISAFLFVFLQKSIININLNIYFFLAKKKTVL